MSNNKDFKVKNGIKPTSYFEGVGTVNVSGNVASLDLSTGSVFEYTPTSDVQVTLSNPAASGTVSQGTLLLGSSGTAYTITYPSTLQWPSGTAPTSPAVGETDVITFSTSDGGTTYSAVQAIDGAN